MFGAKILGLEQSILEKCELTEVTRYNRIAFLFIGLISTSIISFYYFFYLLTGNLITPIFLAFFLGFIYFSILRFTLISISIPLYEDEITFKNLFFNLGNYIRILVFSSFVLTITIPIISIFHHSDFKPKVDLYKLELIKKSQNASFRLVNNKLNSSVFELNKLKNERGILIKKSKIEKLIIDQKLLEFKITQLTKLISSKELEINLKRIQNNKQVFQLINNYSNRLKHTDFPFFRFSLVFKNQSSILFFLILFIGLNLIIPFYIKLLVNNENKYSVLYRIETKSIITNDFNKSKKDCNEYLNKTFGYIDQRESLYSDEPFNRNKKELNYNKKENIDLSTYFDSSESINV